MGGGRNACVEGVRWNAPTATCPASCAMARRWPKLLKWHPSTSANIDVLPLSNLWIDGRTGRLCLPGVNALVCASKPSFWKTIITRLLGLLAPTMPSSTFWISQTNGKSPASSSIVASGLDYHFSSPSSSFLSLLIFPSSLLPLLLPRWSRIFSSGLGVFAINGIIFRVHGDRQAAANDVISTAASRRAGQDSNFESYEGPWA